MKRTQPTAKCQRCGRTVAVRSEAYRSIKRQGLALDDFHPINTWCLRPHKCEHGNWCDECGQHGRGKL